MCFGLLFHLKLCLIHSIVLQTCAFDFSIPVPTSKFIFLELFCIFDNTTSKLNENMSESDPKVYLGYNNFKMFKTRTKKYENVFFLNQIIFT